MFDYFTCLFVGDFDGVRLQRDEGGPAARIERRDLDEKFEAGLQVADPQMRIASGFVVEENGRLRVKDFELKLLRLAAVESRPTPNFDGVGRLVDDRAVGRRIGSHSEEDAVDARIALFANVVAGPAEETPVVPVRLRRIGEDAALLHHLATTFLQLA